MEVIVLDGSSYLLYDEPPQINEPYAFKTNEHTDWNLGKKWISLRGDGDKQLLEIINPKMIRKLIVLLK